MNSSYPSKISEYKGTIPPQLPILPLRNTVAYPMSIMPLVVGIPRSVKLIEDALEGDRLIGLLSMRDSSLEEPEPTGVYEIGTVARIHHHMKAPHRHIHVIIEGLERFRIVKWIKTDPYFRADTVLLPDIVEPGLDVEALERGLLNLTKEVIALSPNIPEGVAAFLDDVDDPRALAYVIASNARLEVAPGQRILEENNVKAKMQLLISHMAKEKEILTLGRKIQTEACEEIERRQREYYLREQLKVIQKELGEEDEDYSIRKDYEERIEKADMPAEARKEAQRELKRLRGMVPHSAEFSVIKTYLDWLLELPWNVLSEDQLDIIHARSVLDEDHYDLEDVKDRLIEYLAVRKLIQERGVQIDSADGKDAATSMGVILCFVGPPGVGKTSLGQSIARALGRKFTRMSLGGMRDEAEIRGHRRTYIGAMPGRVMQVGGIKMKVLAAHRAGLKTVILPKRNEKELNDLPDEVRKDIRFLPVERIEEAIETVLLSPEKESAPRNFMLIAG